MVNTLTKGKKSKTPPIFSHEFIIQNHGDIVSCITMFIVAGIFFESTSPVAATFISLSHNISLNDSLLDIPDSAQGHYFYAYGGKDIFNIIFYSLAFIVFHAIIQEYILDKLNKRMHLSKTKHSKFNESGQLLIFYLLSAVMGSYILYKENYINMISLLWQAYPHTFMTFWVKLFYILQLSYWLHCFPELYFQKVKKEDMFERIRYYLIYLIFISTAYLLTLMLLGLFLLTIHYIVETIFHFSRLFYFAEKNQISDYGFKIWNVIFVIARFATITLSVLTLWYGLPKTSVDKIIWADANFNTPLIRINCLTGIFLMQAWIMWNFINFHLNKNKNNIHNSSSSGTTNGQISNSFLNKKSSAKIKNDNINKKNNNDNNNNVKHRAANKNNKK